MSAEPIPNPSPKNKQRDLITRFKEEYATALVDAQVSVEHTATEGWRRLYADERNKNLEDRRRLAQNLRNLADRVEVRALEEEEEKEITEAKKLSIDIRERHLIFFSQTIEPVKHAVTTCDRIIEEARQQAYRDEKDAPLVNVGLENLMKMAISNEARPRWDDDAGMVILSAAT